MCGNPEALDGSVNCCGSWSTSEWRDIDPLRKELFSGERVPLSTAIDRCTADEGNNIMGRNLCVDGWIPEEDCQDPSQGGCDDQNIWFWTQQPCEVAMKINLEGRIAIIHKHGVTSRPQSETFLMMGRCVSI